MVSTPKSPSSEGQKLTVTFVEISNKNEFQRIDNFLVGYLKGVPKSKVYRIIRKGEVRINKKRCKPETKLQLGDVVRIPPVTLADSSGGQVKIGSSLISGLMQRVLFEDKDVLVLNKPSGIAVHGGSGLSYGLVEAVRQHYGEKQFIELVHRLDRDTSGVIILAKSRKALRDLHGQFRDDKVDKRYHLAVVGRWPKHKRIVDLPLKKNELKSGERMVMVHQEGKPSKTEFRILKSLKEFSLVEAKPITGRTHQIRVHAAHSGFPIIGDAKYLPASTIPAGLEKSRLMLHAYQLDFRLPCGTKKRCVADYDKAFVDSLNKMGLKQ